MVPAEPPSLSESSAPSGPQDRRTDPPDRRQGDRRKRDEPVAQERRTGERRKVERRKRSMNQYDLEADTLEFISAVGRFKEKTGRSFPTWSEVLQIVRDLGYVKQS